MSGKYDHLTREQAIALLERRDRERRYGLVWERDEIEADKAINHDFVVLDIVPDLCIGEPPWDDIIIEGDNWDALRALEATKPNIVDFIYIDPPYNTGNRDWVYNDHFYDRGNIFSHSTWIDFLYRRLNRSRSVLKEGGCISVSISKIEVANLIHIMNIVFSEANIIDYIAWQNKYTISNDSKMFASNHEYILMYAKNIDCAQIHGIEKSQQTLGRYRNPDNDPRGPWKATPLHAKSGRGYEFYYKFDNGVEWTPPKGTHPRFSREKLKDLEKNGEIYFGKWGKGVPVRKTFLSKVSQKQKPSTFWNYKEGGNTHSANDALKKLGLDGDFQNPKPVELIRRLCQIFGVRGRTVTLDFFAGSGTTAHAVMALNAEDGGDRRFIMVSNTEATAEAPDRNLCRDVLRERIRRAGDQLGLSPRVAYLRAATVPIMDLDWDDGLTDQRAWTLIRMMHGLPVAPIEMTDGIASAALPEGGTVAYLEELSDAGAARLAAFAAAGPVIAYAWAPGQVRVRFEDHPLIEPRPVVESLLKRFRP